MSQDRIYFVGAHSTGKTTMARWVRDRYGLPMIAEVAEFKKALRVLVSLSDSEVRKVWKSVDEDGA